MFKLLKTPKLRKCPGCRKQHFSRLSRCDRCLEKACISTHRRKREKAAQDLCASCGKRLRINKNHCEICRQSHRESVKRYWQKLKSLSQK